MSDDGAASGNESYYTYFQYDIKWFLMVINFYKKTHFPEFTLLCGNKIIDNIPAANPPM